MTALATVIGRDVFANRPAASIAGRLFHSSDTNVLYRDNGSSWDTIATSATGLTDPTTTRGDLLVRGASAVGRLALGTSGQQLISNGTDAVWGALGTSINQLSADVTMSSANTYYDGPSLTLGVGVWLLIGHIQIEASAGVSGKIFTKLWNGTTVLDANQSTTDEATGNGHTDPALFGVRTIASGTETWKISAAGDGGGATLKIKAAMSANSPGNYASTLIAVQIG